MKRSSVIGMALVAATALSLPGSRVLGEQDHLLGLKAKDVSQTVAPASVTVTSPLFAGPCELKRATFVLLQAEKNGGDDPRGGSPGNFVCYKAKCAIAPGVLPADTQFGALTMELKKSHLLCLPADAPLCGDGELDGTEQCDGSADAACPGLCNPDCSCSEDLNICGDNELDGLEECDGTADSACAGLCQSDCTCGCPGHIVGGSCWLVGAAGESCDTVCANQGKEYDPATETFAGSGGTLENCEAVLTAFGHVASIAGPCGSNGLGCCHTGGAGIFCSAPATTAAAAESGVNRFCACE